MKSKEEIEAGLAQCYGSEQFHRFSILFPKHIITDGVKYLCDSADCYWLLDIIASYHAKCMKDKKLQEMQFWKLTVHPKSETKPMTVGAVMKHERVNMATVTCERDKNDVVITQDVEYTDFPLNEIKLWVAPSGDDRHFTILLPSEY
jgi:hypothetical protein